MKRSGQPLPIGIDIGASGVRMIQLAIGEHGPVVIAAVRGRWADDVREKTQAGRTPELSLVKDQLIRLLRQGGFVGRECTLSLPREFVTVKSLRLPPMPDQDLLIAAEFELRQTITPGPSEPRIGLIPCGEVRSGAGTQQEVLGILADSNSIDSFVESWHALGFVPTGLDFEPLALYRTVGRFARRRDDAQEVNVVLDFGLRRTHMLIGRGRGLSFFKCIEVGGWQLTHAVSRKLGITTEEAWTLRNRLIETASTVDVTGSDPVRQAVFDATRPLVDHLAREVVNCLRYFSVNFRGSRPTRLRVAGNEAGDPSVLRVLSDALPLTVEPSRALLNADLSRMKPHDRSGVLATWSLAFGLGLRDAEGPFPDRTGASRESQAQLGSTSTPLVEPVADADRSSNETVVIGSRLQPESVRVGSAQTMAAAPVGVGAISSEADAVASEVNHHG
jgi:Tfp pilus assembly PilM family ATPase